MNQNPKMDNLLRRFEMLYKQQNAMQQELELVRQDIKKLLNEHTQTFEEAPVEPVKVEVIEAEPIVQSTQNVDNQPVTKKIDLGEIKIEDKLTFDELPEPKPRTDLEKFIGENLSNKIGIIITVIGIAIGVKYAIDNNLISPLTRIILGYAMGFGLFAVSVRLRPKYLDLSAVILSGALATFYFVTYVAYDFYALMPQALAFVMMVVVTVFTVVSALSYDRQIIAVGGLVGAYFVPFLLSNNSDRPDILFSYMTVINIGILVIAFRRYWQVLYYLAFGVTWLIFVGWLTNYQDSRFALAFTFLIVFFSLFYATFLAYKFKKDKRFDAGDVVVLLLNSAIFYGLGYYLLQNNETGQHLLGVFTVLNAVVHFTVSLAVFRRQLADRNLFFLVSGLVLVFLTMAVPVQLEGHWVTLFWAGEMALVFWIGRTKGVAAYEYLSYPLWVLTFLSLTQQWIEYSKYDPNIPASRIVPIVNILFLTSIIVIAAYLFIRKVNNTEPASPTGMGYAPAYKHTADVKSYINQILLAVSVLLIFTLFFNEIGTFFNQNYAEDRKSTRLNSSHVD